MLWERCCDEFQQLQLIDQTRHGLRNGDPDLQSKHLVFRGESLGGVNLREHGKRKTRILCDAKRRNELAKGVRASPLLCSEWKLTT